MSENHRAVTAVTHAGNHHGDEVLAAWFLERIYGTDLTIVRSSEPEVMEAADILFDCGGLYNPAAGRFDHHSGAKVPDPPHGRVCGYATAGLVWREYGPRIVKSFMLQHDGESWEMQRKACTPAELDTLLLSFVWRLDTEMVAPVDAWDRGMRPDRHTAATFLPLQWVLGQLEFEVAVAAMGKVFMHRLKAVINSEGDAWKLRRDLLDNGETEFFDTPQGILVVAGSNNRVDVQAAKHVVGSMLAMPCVGVISPLRHGSRWVLFLTRALPDCVTIPQSVEHLANRRCFYHHQREVLCEFAKSAAEAPADSRA